MPDVLSEVRPSAHAATVVVMYNGSKLTPAPFINFTQEPTFDDAGTRQTTTTRITLEGSVVIIPSGSYEQMFIKQNALRATFSQDYRDFAILAGPANKTLPDGTVIYSGVQPRVASLNIKPDIQVQRIDYTVELEAFVNVSGLSGTTSSFSNQWSFREDQDSCTLRVTHNISAQGIQGNTDAFEQAIRKVRANIGIDKLPIQIPGFTEPNASGIWGITHPSNPAGGPIFEISVQREEVADVANGSYSITENFVIVSGVPFYFTQRSFGFSEDQNGVANVTVQGTVQGLGRTLTQNIGEGGVGFQRAISGFLNQVKPQVPFDASGVYIRYKPIALTSLGSGLNVTNPTSVSITENRCRGAIDFSYTFTDDPQSFLPSGIVSLQSSFNRSEAIRIFASHPIPFRRLGPIIQDMKTNQEGTIVLSASVKAKNNTTPALDTNRAIQATQDELNRLRGQHVNPSDFVSLRISSQEQTHSEKDLTCNASVTYLYATDLSNSPVATASIVLRSI